MKHISNRRWGNPREDRLSRNLPQLLPIVCVLCIQVKLCASGLPLYDAFSDFHEAAGSPATWLPGVWDGGERDASSGDLIVTHRSAMSTFVDELTGVKDTSIRTQVRLGRSNGNDVVNVWARSPGPINDSLVWPAYWAGINGRGQIFIGHTGSDGMNNVLASTSTGLDPTREDVVLQFDVFDSELGFSAWKAGHVMPAEPLLVSVDEQINDGGQIGVTLFPNSNGGGEAASATFRWFSAVQTRGDLNGNDLLDNDDIDILSRALVSSEVHGLLDLNGDSVVNHDDRIFWVVDLARTHFGDANLDGEFDSGDLVSVFQAGDYEDVIPTNSGWAEGDWNGDGDFTSGDLVVAFQEGGYEQGPRVTANIVPEPSCSILLGIGLIGFSLLRKRE